MTGQAWGQCAGPGAGHGVRTAVVRLVVTATLAGLLALVLGCGGVGTTQPGQPVQPTPPPPAPPVEQPTTGLLRPSDLAYVGAFRLPEGSGGSDWAYSGDAVAYFPGGDPEGPDDGFPGSLFGVGHDWHKQVSEISIPVPVDSPGRRLADLNTARTLRPFTDVHTSVGRLGVLDEMLRVGMTYLPPQGSQATGKLYLCFGQHFQEDDDRRVASHMWCETDLSGSAGAWWVGDESIYAVNDYMLEIPQAWADAHAAGMRLGTGRFRDGGWSGQGPSLFAIAPWRHGDPPPDGTRLEALPLLRYSSTATDEEPFHTLRDYHHSDEWSGGAWLTAGDRAALIFVGTKGVGECWYGLPDGTVWEEPYPDDPLGQRGWWSTQFVGQILFYDPADLAAVARGEMQPWEPQPYATMNLDGGLFAVAGTQQKHHVGDCCFDRARGLLYLFEPLADDEKSLVHVWRVQ
ncbi:MAG: hypothetical protein AB7Y46_09145 [Armatimonadota bacterium]